MNIRHLSCTIAGILISSLTVLATYEQPARADTWCGFWESNCKVDGIAGTSSSNPFHIKIRNSCNRDVIASIQYIPYNQSNWHTSKVTIRSGTVRPVALTSNAIFAISAGSADGDLSWPIKEVEMRGTDYTHNFTCRNQ